MAIFEKGPLGGYSGSLGNVVGSKLGKKNVLRRKPRKRTASTLKITSQNLKLPLVSKFLSPYKRLISIGYNDKSNMISAFNRAVQYNLKNSVLGTFPDFELNYPKIVLIQGPLEPAWSAKIFITGKKLGVSWEIPPSVKLKLVAKDQSCIIIFNSTKGENYTYTAKADRDQLSIPILKSTYKGDVYYGWMFFISPDGKAVSNSAYLGSVTRLL